jgi:hypothetical protein
MYWLVLQQAILWAIEMLCILNSHKAPVKQLTGAGHIPATTTQSKSNNILTDAIC